MKVVKGVGLLVAAALVASGCTSGDGDSGELVEAGEDRVVAVTDEWRAIPPGPLDGWNPRRVVGGGPGSTKFYVFGADRVFVGDESFEVLNTFASYDVSTGEWEELPTPVPAEGLEFRAGHGFVTESAAYFTGLDCLLYEYATSAGTVACQPETVISRFLRFDLDGQVWEDWDVPEFAAEPRDREDGREAGALSLIRGAYYPDDPLLLTRYQGEVFTFDPRDESWGSFDGVPSLVDMCTDGERIYGFERSGTEQALTTLADTFDPAGGVSPEVVPIDLPWVEMTVGAEAAVEEVSVPYLNHMSSPSHNASELGAMCTPEGVLIVPRSSGALVGHGLFRARGSDTWVEVPTASALESGYRYQYRKVQANDGAYLVASTRFREDEPPTELPVFRFDPATQRFSELPALGFGAGLDFVAVGESALVVLPRGRLEPISDRWPIRVLAVNP